MPRKSEEPVRPVVSEDAVRACGQEERPPLNNADRPQAADAGDPPLLPIPVDPGASPLAQARAVMLNHLLCLRRRRWPAQHALRVPGALVDRIAVATPRVAQQGGLERLLLRNSKAAITAVQWVPVGGDASEGADVELVRHELLDTGTPQGPSAPRAGWDRPPLGSAGLAAAQMLSALAQVETALPGTLQALATATPRPVPAGALRSPGTPLQYPSNAAALDFSDSPWLGRTAISPESLGAVFVVGASGSGKTTSYVLPPLEAVLNYRAADAPDLPAAGLVIDPKAELVPLVRRWATARGELDRIVEIGHAPPLRIFTDDDGYTVRERYEIIQRLCAPQSNGHDFQSTWSQRAHEMSRNLLEVDDAFQQRTGLPLLELVSSALAGTDRREQGQWAALADLYRQCVGSVDVVLRRAAELITSLLVVAGLDSGLNPLLKFLALCGDEMGNQFYYLVSTARLVTDSAGDPALGRFIDLDVRRGRAASDARASLDMLQLVNQGCIVLYQPEAGAVHDLIGRTLKARFFDAARRREHVRRPLLYVCDEFQRFYTSDVESGEHAFLDCARAYRTTCVLATQSIPALAAAIGRDPSRSDKLAALLANCRTQIFLRTVDAATRTTLTELIPGPPDPRLPHAVRVRPLAGLAVGECYAIHDGGWSIYRYRMPRAA